jgi:hypothetical protein
VVVVVVTEEQIKVAAQAAQVFSFSEYPILLRQSSLVV